MEEKIKWYEEILHLDPARLFFPLARLYAQNNDLEKAIQTLRSGLDKDPRHVEAKMFLLSLLIRQGQGIDQEGWLLEGITAVLEQYPEVWTAWAREQEKSGHTDLGVALRFVGSALQGRPLSWTEILNQGFAALAGETDSRPSEQDGSGPTSGSHGGGLDFVTSEMSSGADTQATALFEEAPADQGVQADLISPDDDLEMGHDEQPVEQAEDASFQEDGAGETDQAEEPERDDSASLASYRTRTMADILAEQGDYSQALDIYVELQQNAESQDEYEELQAAIQSMQEHIEASARQPEKSEGSCRSSEYGRKTALVSRLERLAQRLESRGGQA